MAYNYNNRATITTFVSSVRLPFLINKAAAKTGDLSMSHYIRMRLAEAVAKDLDMDADEIKADFPEPRRVSREVV